MLAMNVLVPREWAGPRQLTGKVYLLSIGVGSVSVPEYLSGGLVS